MSCHPVAKSPKPEHRFRVFLLLNLRRRIHSPVERKAIGLSHIGRHSRDRTDSACGDLLGATKTCSGSGRSQTFIDFVPNFCSALQRSAMDWWMTTSQPMHFAPAERKTS